MSDYLVDSVKRDKYNEPKDKTTHADLLEAEKMLRKYASPPMTRSVYSKKGGYNHRTVVHEEKGLRPGKVEKLTVKLVLQMRRGGRGELEEDANLVFKQFCKSNRECRG